MPCDDAAPDSGLQQDTCISVNDGPQPNWWLSPDIVLNGTLKDGTITGLAPDQAFINADNKVDVNVNRAATATCQLPEGTANIIIEVWVSPPGLNLSPFGAKQISSALTMPLSQLPANSHKALSQIGKQITWTPTSTN